MKEKYKYDVFISYSRKDTGLANKICDAFEKNGISFFIDRKGICGGMEFPTVLADAILESRIFLYLASENSYKSKFTINEITFAFNEKPKDSIIPYILDGSNFPNALRFVFSGINWRSLKEHPIETVLMDDILNLLGRKRMDVEHIESSPCEKVTMQVKSVPIKEQQTDEDYKLESYVQFVIYSLLFLIFCSCFLYQANRLSLLWNTVLCLSLFVSMGYSIRGAYKNDIGPLLVTVVIDIVTAFSFCKVATIIHLASLTLKPMMLSHTPWYYCHLYWSLDNIGELLSQHLWLYSIIFCLTFVVLHVVVFIGTAFVHGMFSEIKSE